MTTPTQAQPFQGGAYSGQAGQGGPTVPQAYQQNERNQSAVVQYAGPAGAQQQFEKYVVIHVATTCDEHGVYVTKDSAEVIEIGWTVVDARDPTLPEVCQHTMFSPSWSDESDPVLCRPCELAANCNSP